MKTTSEASPAATVELELRPGELTEHWKRCGQTADWLSSYLVHDFELSARSAVKSMLSTVINELLENAVKFSASESATIKILARHEGALVKIETRNTASARNTRLLEGTLADLERTSPDSLFAQRIVKANESSAPGIGLVIIKRDYGARIATSLTPRPDGNVDVHVSVELDATRAATT